VYFWKKFAVHSLGSPLFLSELRATSGDVRAQAGGGRDSGRVGWVSLLLLAMHPQYKVAQVGLLDSDPALLVLRPHLILPE